MKEMSLLNETPKKTPMEEISSQSSRPRSKKKMIISICACFFSVLFILIGSVVLFVNARLSTYLYVPDEENTSSLSSKKPIESVEQQETQPTGDAQKVDGMYHDDMVTNILLLGVDDYQPNDPGRSDSMLMVSLDRRHKKLKLTSFMRDTYVSIPGYNYYKLNTGYFLGGAPLQVKTIEKNFQVDIDRYVIIDFEAFPKIIDALGGITVELSAAEAEEMNEKSGVTGATEGVNQLSGAQARYYSRIRNCKYTDPDTGNVYYDDYGRIRRQQRVIDILIENFQDASVTQMLTLANEIVPYLVSNISPDEMVTLATDSLTYMNYSMETCQVPNNELHYGATLYPPHIGEAYSVLVPDTLEDNVLYLNRFIYEDSFPELAAFKLPSEMEESSSSSSEESLLGSSESEDSLSDFSGTE